MEPEDDRTETDIENDPGVGRIHRPGRLRLALATFTLIAVLALIVIGAIRLWQL